MISIRDILEKSTEYIIPISHKTIPQEWLYTCENDYFFVCRSDIIAMPGFIKRIGKKYVRGIYEMSSIYTCHNVPYILFQLSDHKGSIKIGVFWKDAFSRKSDDEKELSESFLQELKKLPESFSNDFEKYICLLEEWINREINPDECSGSFEFNMIDVEELDDTILTPRYYTRENVKLRRLLKEEDTVKLSDVADVIDTKVEYYAQGEEKKSFHWRTSIIHMNLKRLGDRDLALTLL